MRAVTDRAGRDFKRPLLGFRSPGDYAVFRYDVFTLGKNPTKVGDAFVNCVTQFPPTGSQCQGVTRLAGRGDFTFQGLAPR